MIILAVMVSLIVVWFLPWQVTLCLCAAPFLVIFVLEIQLRREKRNR